MPSARVFLGLGSNLGDRLNYIRGAVLQLNRVDGFIAGARSSVYQSPPWGFDSPNQFYNAVIEAQWAGTPSQLQTRLDEVEAAFWRVKRNGPPSLRYQDRTIDIDILWLEGVELDSTRLKLPHPLAHQRAFVLVPWCEIAPELMLRGKPLTQWLGELPEREVEGVTAVGEL
jgi:2-amino-4-hydroxy-6-hydroxymethyldihydropteridine diphosphokinase